MAWYSTIFNKDRDTEGYRNRLDPMPKNIYEKDGVTYKEHTKRYHFIHFVFKYKFLVPLIHLARKMFHKRLKSVIPAENHNRNIILFDKAYDKALEVWCTKYRGLKDTNDLSSEALRFMKDSVVTMALYDTAYREFLNILMYETAIEMNNYYKDHPDKIPGHLFFSVDIYDVKYYLLEKQIEYREMYRMVDKNDKL